MPAARFDHSLRNAQELAAIIFFMSEQNGFSTWEPYLGQVRMPRMRSERFGYSNTVRTLTQGRGAFTMIFNQYEPVPAGITKEVVEKRVKAGKVR